MTYADPTLDEQVAALFPPDGPHGEDRTTAAGRVIEQVVRYLNHATWHAAATPYPSTIDSVLRSLSAATFGMDQLLRQLATQLDRQAALPGVYSDDGRAAHIVAANAADHLHDAQTYLAGAQRALAAAASQTSHLDLNPPEEQP